MFRVSVGFAVDSRKLARFQKTAVPSCSTLRPKQQFMPSKLSCIVAVLYAHTYKLQQQDVVLTRLIRKAQTPEAETFTIQKLSCLTYTVNKVNTKELHVHAISTQLPKLLQSVSLKHQQVAWPCLAAGPTLSDQFMWKARLRHRSHVTTVNITVMSFNSLARWMFPTVCWSNPVQALKVHY